MLVIAVACIGQAGAHHSISANFDPARTAQLRGFVVEYPFRSPHSYLVIEGIGVVDGVLQSDTPTRWQVGSDSVPGMRDLFRVASTLLGAQTRPAEKGNGIRPDELSVETRINYC
jgi:hypothetical protein